MTEISGQNTDQTSTRTRILDSAERLMRTKGYNAFSTRDIATEIGIKAASVHYHFPTKADLGSAVVDRYIQRFLDGLGDVTDYGDDSVGGLAAYVGLFRRALLRERLLCLCAVLGAESAGLPVSVSSDTHVFFRRNLQWLQSLFRAGGQSETDARKHAFMVLAFLEGALIVAMSTGDTEGFEHGAQALSAHVLAV